MEFITLNNGVKMPMEGFGVFQVPDHEICEQAVLDAIALYKVSFKISLSYDTANTKSTLLVSLAE